MELLLLHLGVSSHNRKALLFRGFLQCEAALGIFRRGRKESGNFRGFWLMSFHNTLHICRHSTSNWAYVVLGVFYDGIRLIAGAQLREDKCCYNWSWEGLCSNMHLVPVSMRCGISINEAPPCLASPS
jgi:hypothetical protein